MSRLDQLDVRLAMERAAIRRDFARAHAKVQAWAPRPLPRRKGSHEGT